MQSRTSFFNAAVFRKNVTRFWPIWGFYLAVWIFALPVNLLSTRYYATPLSINADVIRTGVFLGPIGAMSVSIVSAMAAWSILYNSRACHGFACLPVRRESLFVSAAAAGLLPLLGANVLVAVLTILTELALGGLDLAGVATWFGMVTLELLLFYGFATLCAMLTGNIVVLPIVYVVLNLVVMGVEVLIRGLMNIFLFGYEGRAFVSTIGRYGSPVIGLYETVIPVEFTKYDAALDRWYYGVSGITGWGLLAVYGVVGILFLAAALLLLRARRMESAGDTVAIHVLKPVFRWCMGLGAGVCFGLLMFVMFFSGEAGGLPVAGFFAVCMVIGSFVGWFIGEMMIKKSFRVFRRGWSGFGGWGICAAVLVLGVIAMHFDLLGLEHYTPRPERVEAVTVSVKGDSVVLRQPENIAAAVAAHRQVLEHQDRYDSGTSWSHPGYYRADEDVFWLTLRYTLRGGREVERQYRLNYDRADAATQDDALLLQELVNSSEAIGSRKGNTLPSDRDAIIGGQVSMTLPATVCAELAGYTDVETYLLRERAGYSAAEIAGMDDDRRRAALSEVLYYQSTTDVMYKFGTWGVPEAAIEDYGVPLLDLEKVDYSRVLFEETAAFTREELWELYTQCIVPDMEEGTIGRIWLVENGDYDRQVYQTSINIDMHTQNPDEAYRDGDYGYAFFHTVPTVNARRTNAWLAAHGVTQYTAEQLRAMTY